MTSNPEVSVIGAALISPECIPDVAEYVSPADFGAPITRAAAESIWQMWQSGSAIDPVTLMGRMRGCGLSDDDVAVFLRDCMTVTPTAANVLEYARMVRADAKMRSLRRIGGELIEADGSEDWQTAASTALTQVEEVLDGDAHTETLKGDAWLNKYVEEETELIRDPLSQIRATGFAELDAALCGGLHKNGLYVFGARPGMGKTTVALNIAECVAKQGKKVLFVSLEMSDKEIMDKRAAATCRFFYSDLSRGKVEPERLGELHETLRELTARPFVTNTRTGMTVADIGMMARRERDTALIVVDYIGLVKPEASTKSRYEDYTNISGDLKRLAMRLHVPVVCLSQLNRENTKSADKRPTLAHLRDTGAIEQDADAVVLLHRPEYYDADGEDKPIGTIELIVAKNRHGKCGTIKMAWDGAHGRIAPIADGRFSELPPETKTPFD